MNEYVIGYTAVGGVFALAFMCLFYMLGGRSNKWLRRFISPLFMFAYEIVATLVMTIFSWWSMIIYPLIAIGTSFGYGGDTTWKKVWRRTVFCIANLTVGLFFVIHYGGNMWMVFVPNVGVAVWSIWMGVKNPVYAPAEETAVCALLYLMTAFYPFVTIIGK